MKQYLLSVYQPATGTRPDPERLERIGRDLDALRQELTGAGAWVFSGGLCDPQTATVLTGRGGDVVITDGPFLEGKEYLGGFTVIRAPDLDAALSWAAKLTRAATLPVEVRPFEGDVD
jgi:hypothetical protein